MIEIVGANGMRMELQAGKIGHPRQRCGIARNNFFGRSAGRKAQRDGLDPGRPRLRRALLIEILAVNAIWITDEHVRPTARTAQRSVGDGNVVTDHIQLCVARLRKKNFAGVTDRDFLAGNVQHFSIRLGGHGY